MEIFKHNHQPQHQLNKSSASKFSAYFSKIPVGKIINITSTTKLQTKSAGRLKKHFGLALYIGTICIVGFISPAQADWFKVGDIKANLITPLYTLVNDNLGFVAFAVGGASTFLVRGQDMYQKAIAFGVGSLGTAGAVKLAQTVLHLG